MDINIKKFSGRCDKIAGLDGHLELFSYLNKIVKDDKDEDSDSIKLFPVKLKDFFTQEVLFMFVLRRSRDNFDTILPIFYSKTNSQVLRDLINLDFGDISLSMKDVYTIKSILSGTSSEQYNNIFTMYFSNDLGLHYDTFVGSKIVKLNSSDNETIVSNAPFLMSERHNLSYKDGSVNLEYMKNKLIESLGNDVNAENFDISHSATIVILASLASGLLSILNLKPMMIGVSGRLGYTFTKLANSFWSLFDSLELLKSKNLVGDLLSLNGFTVSISENLYDNVSEFLNRGYGVSKLDKFHLTVFHFCEGDSIFKNTNFDELYLELDIKKKDEDIQNQVDNLYFQADDLRVQRIKADIDGFVDSRFGSYGCIGYEFLDFVYK